MKLAKTIILAISLAAGGCSVLEYKPLGEAERIAVAQVTIEEIKQHLQLAN